jgi:hypothetical protein
MRKSLLAVVVGYLVTAIVTVPIVGLITLTTVHDDREAPVPAAAPVVQKPAPPPLSRPVELALLAAGALGAALGGAAAAALAGRAGVLHGYLVGLVTTLLALLGLATAHSQRPKPVWFLVVWLIVPIPAAILGGALVALRQAARRAR